MFIVPSSVLRKIWALIYLELWFLPSTSLRNMPSDRIARSEAIGSLITFMAWLQAEIPTS